MVNGMDRRRSFVVVFVVMRASNANVRNVRRKVFWDWDWDEGGRWKVTRGMMMRIDDVGVRSWVDGLGSIEMTCRGAVERMRAGMRMRVYRLRWSIDLRRSRNRRIWRGGGGVPCSKTFKE